MSSRRLTPIVWIAVLAVITCIGLAAVVRSRTVAAFQQSAHATEVAQRPGQLTPTMSTNSADSPQGGGKQLWWDPMLGPSSISDHPGKSAMGMDMVPYTGHTAQGPEVTIDPAVVQNMGVQTAPVTRGPLHKTIRTVGLFKLPEPGLHDVSLKVGGWIDKLYAGQEGMHVNQGEPLFALYSPDLQVTGQELISAVQSKRSLAPDASATLKKEADDLINSARRKLQLWDVDEREIDAIGNADRPPRDVIFYSPATGHLEEKMIVQGSAVQPGTKLLRIADHSRMWLDAEVYEEQVPLVKMGQTVEATLDAIPGKTFTGKVTFIYPHVGPMTRTLLVRATFDTPDFELKPGMYADANLITEPVADAVQAPQEAVIDTGTKQIAFVAEGGGHFSPRTVRAGIRGDDDRVEILDGLAVGETVVTSGQFLMDVESRTNEAIAKLRGGSPAAGASESMPRQSGRPASAPATMPPMPSSATSQPSSEPTAMEAPALSVIHCPMAQADWIQRPGETANPYLAAEMRQCGSVTGHIHTPPAGSPLSGVADAYLNVQKALAADRVDLVGTEQLKAAAGRLDGAQYGKLRGATERLAAAREVPAARQQFKTVSGALIAALESSQSH